MKSQIPAVALTVLSVSSGILLGPQASSASAEEIKFIDVTRSSGIDFVHNTGAFGQKWLPETMGSGVVLFDYNGDDRLDILFINGTRFHGKPGQATTQKLYRNSGGMKFEDATSAAGLAIDRYCMGGAAADLDNDGDQDLYLSCVGTDLLMRNDSGRWIEKIARFLPVMVREI